MKISELIEDLQSFQKEYGDLNVCMAKDPEGNGFYRPCNIDITIGKFLDSDSFEADDGTEEFGVATDICIWP